MERVTRSAAARGSLGWGQDEYAEQRGCLVQYKYFVWNYKGKDMSLDKNVCVQTQRMQHQSEI